MSYIGFPLHPHFLSMRSMRHRWQIGTVFSIFKFQVSEGIIRWMWMKSKVSDCGESSTKSSLWFDTFCWNLFNSPVESIVLKVAHDCLALKPISNFCVYVWYCLFCCKVFFFCVFFFAVSVVWFEIFPEHRLTSVLFIHLKL